MRRMKGIVAFLLLTSACGPSRLEQLREMNLRWFEKKPLEGGFVDLQVTSFDGRGLTARVLISTKKTDSFVMDRRLIPWSTLKLNNIRACDTKEPLEHSMGRAVVPPPRAEDMITIRWGYWWGADVTIPLFDKTTATEPGCFEAELVVLDKRGRVAATKSIRVARTEKAEDTRP